MPAVNITDNKDQYQLSLANQLKSNEHETIQIIALPQVETKSVMVRYPNWRISNDVYRVTYENTGGANIIYKLILNNGNKRLRVKTNKKGEFLD